MATNLVFTRAQVQFVYELLEDTFACIKNHFPLTAPFQYVIYATVQVVLISGRIDIFIQDTIVGKEWNVNRVNYIRNIINTIQEKSIGHQAAVLRTFYP